MTSKIEMPEEHTMAKHRDYVNARCRIFNDLFEKVRELFNVSDDQCEFDLKLEHGDIYAAHVLPNLMDANIYISAVIDSHQRMRISAEKGHGSSLTGATYVHLESKRRYEAAVDRLQEGIEVSKVALAEREAALDQAAKAMPPFAQFLDQIKSQ